MNIPIRLYFLVAVLVTATSAHSAEWHDMQNKTMDQIEKHPIKERIEILGGITTAGNNPVLNSDTAEVFHRAQQMLITIPGHAEHYGSIILEKHALYKADILEGTKQGRLIPYHDTSMRAFGILKNLPSPETVRVLGEMLSEEWLDPDEQEYYEPSLGASAMMCLSRLPIVGKPPTTGENALAGWQNWYSQIKEGRRTFRFEDDPQEYSLSGPVRETLNPDIPRASKRPLRQDSQNTIQGNSESSSSKVPAITAIVTAFLIGGGYWFYRRKATA